MMSGIDQRVHLHPNRRRPPRLGMSNFLRDMVENPLAQIDRRDRYPLEFRRLGITGDVVEDARHVAAYHGSAVKNDKSV